MTRSPSFAGLFNGGGGGIQAGQRVEIQQAENTGGRGRGLRRHLAQGGHEFAKPDLPDVTLIGIFRTPFSDQISQLLLLRRFKNTARKRPSICLQITLHFEQWQDRIAIGLNPVTLHHLAPANPAR